MFYPGSKTPVKTFENLSPVPEKSLGQGEVNLGNGQTFRVNGSLKEFYRVGSLARALNRRSVKIRKWEAEGVIPKSTFVLPSDDKRGRRRLYTEEQILGLRIIAMEEGLLEPSAGGRWKSIDGTNFKERALQLFRDLENK